MKAELIADILFTSLHNVALSTERFVIRRTPQFNAIMVTTIIANCIILTKVLHLHEVKFHCNILLTKSHYNGTEGANALIDANS